MTGWPILSLVVFTPLDRGGADPVRAVGQPPPHPRDRADGGARQPGVQPAPARLPARWRGVPVPRGHLVDRGLRDALHARRRRPVGRARPAHHRAQRGEHLLFLRPDPDAGQGVLRHDAAADDRHAGRLRQPRPLPLLRLLGAQPDPDVPGDRDLGRPAADLRDRQVRDLHAGRVAADAGRDPGRGDRARIGRQPVHLQLRDAARLRLHRLAPGPRLRRLLPGLRHQGPDVAVPHLAPRRARRGPDGGQHHPGRGAAEAGRLRLPALLAAARARTRRSPSPRSSSAWRWWPSCTGPWSAWCSRTSRS